MSSLTVSITANCVLLLLCVIAHSRWIAWKSRYHEFLSDLDLIIHGAQCDGEREVLERWNLFLKTRMDDSFLMDLNDMEDDDEDE